MRRFVFTARAYAGFEQILDSVEREFGAMVAEETFEQLASAFEMLAENPDIGRPRPDITPDETIHFWSAPPLLIAYRASGEVVEILFVERAERDWAGILPDDD